jgi:hypothetical protein
MQEAGRSGLLNQGPKMNNFCSQEEGMYKVVVNVSDIFSNDTPKGLTQ